MITTSEVQYKQTIYMHYILTGIYEIYIGSIAPVLLHQCYKIYQKDILIYTLLFVNFNLGVLNNFPFILL